MANVDRSLVERLPLFAGLSSADIDAILLQARPARFSNSAHVFDQGAPAEAFFLLLHGHVQAVKTTPDGQQIVMRYIAPGEMFGVAMAIGTSTYPATAIAVDESVALSWPATAWPQLVAQFPSLATHALQTIGKRLQDAHTRIVEAATEDVERRLAHALLRLARQAGRKTEDGVEIDFPIGRQDLAEMTGTTLHTVSRTLSAWEQRGLVTGGRRRIVIRDPHALFGVAERRGGD